ncbi:MAG: hypothetical protein ACREHD_33670 [Pirellulales bacterium]
MPRRFQFSLRAALTLVFFIALIAWPTSVWLRTYLANRGLVPVKGCVVFKGQPLQDAKVVMNPLKPGRKALQGVTNARGDYETDTLASPGEYAVSIAELGPTKRGLPLKYGDASMSGLTISVSAGGQNQFDFALSD